MKSVNKTIKNVLNVLVKNKENEYVAKIDWIEPCIDITIYDGVGIKKFSHYLQKFVDNFDNNYTNIRARAAKEFAKLRNAAFDDKKEKCTEKQIETSLKMYAAIVGEEDMELFFKTKYFEEDVIVELDKNYKIIDCYL